MLTLVWVTLTFAQLIKPIPQHFGAAAGVFGAFFEILVEEPEDRKGWLCPRNR